MRDDSRGRAVPWWNALLVLGLLASGCTADAGGHDFETGPNMNPGENCRRCHGASTSPYPDAPAWTAAGTVYPGPDSPATDGMPGVTVLLLQPDGQEVIETLTTNEVGNFYTATALPTNFRVAVEYEGERLEMPCGAPSGGCGACHAQPPIGRTPGRIFIPQAPEATNVSSTCDGF